MRWTESCTSSPVSRQFDGCSSCIAFLIEARWDEGLHFSLEELGKNRYRLIETASVLIAVAYSWVLMKFLAN